MALKCTVGFRGSNASGGRIVLLPGVFQSLAGQASARRVSHKPCFRQAHCFVQGLWRFLCGRFHICGFPKKGG